MNLPSINTNSKRQLSCSTQSKSTYSLSTTSASSNKSKESSLIPVLIQLCIHPNENYAYRTMRLLLSSRYNYSINVSDEFGCNVLMYSLRYQRYQLFEYLLDDLCLELNFNTKDRNGNNILHYAILYSGNNTQIIEKLIEIYKKFSMNIDERNNFGFTPLLLAAFCGRYDFVFTLLTKTDASPFVRDYIQLKNMFDYVEIDIKHIESRKSQQSSPLSPERKRLIHQLHQTIPYRKKVYVYKNFFEKLFLKSIKDRTGLCRSLIIEIFHFEYLTNLVDYLNERYPHIKTSRTINENLPTKFLLQQTSNIDIHNILNLFDPKLKSKAIPPLPNIRKSTTKPSVAFKRLSTKVSAISAFTKPPVGKKRPSLTTTRVN